MTPLLLRPLGLRRVSLLWGGLTLSAIGDQLYAVALVWVAVGVFGLTMGRGGGVLLNGAGLLFLLGLLMFCGAVYVPLFGGPSLGRTAPVGGTMLIGGWLLFAIAAIRA